jgi:hypothetical protein
MDGQGRVAVWAAALMWAFCLVAHALTAAGRATPVLHPLLVGGVGAAIIWALYWPHRSGPAPVLPQPPSVVALIVLSFVMMMWPMVVGSGVPRTHPFSFGRDMGVPSGPPGDRHLNNHGRRVRALTEEEYQRYREWEGVRESGFSACVSGIILAYALSYRRLRAAPHQAPQQTAEA